MLASLQLPNSSRFVARHSKRRLSKRTLLKKQCGSSVETRVSSLHVEAATQVDSGQRDALNLPPAYRVIRKLGQGGMGELYLAKDVRRNIECVIKVVRSDKRFDPM